MTASEKMAFKNQILEYCLSLIQKRIDVARTAMQRAQEAANSEEKSSAGDKYETGRAMNQNEKDLYSKQLAENLRELAAIGLIPVNQQYNEVRAGAFLRCSHVRFFVAAGLGKQVINNEEIIIISPMAPVAKQLQGKTAGENFSFNNRTETIIEIF